MIITNTGLCFFHNFLLTLYGSIVNSFFQNRAKKLILVTGNVDLDIGSALHQVILYFGELLISHLSPINRNLKNRLRAAGEAEFGAPEGRHKIVNYENAFFCNFIIFLYFSVIYGII